MKSKLQSPQKQSTSTTKTVNKYFVFAKYHITQIQGTFFKYQAFLFTTGSFTKNKYCGHTYYTSAMH
jgi:hypothetical protein